MTIFVRSLPKGCSFSIIGFGTSYEIYTKNDDDNITILPFSNKNKNEALTSIKSIKSNLGGTDILQPLTFAQE